MASKLSKVRRTDYRKGGGQSATVPDGLDHLNAINRREQAEHDKAVACHAETTLRAIGADLGKRHCWDRANHEHRWIMQRLAAVGRRLDSCFC
jgi:hypothetical protein